jgi:calcineurin-like phosphoesterase family protein
MHRDSFTKQRRYLDVFRSVQAYGRRRIEGREVLLSHFPYTGDTPSRGQDRHLQHRLRDYGVPIIHGHVHSPQRVTRSSVRTDWGMRTNTLQVHVGVDAWDLAPVSLEQVAAIIADDDL